MENNQEPNHQEPQPIIDQQVSPTSPIQIVQPYSQPSPNKRNLTKLWIAFLVAPIPILLFTLFLQFFKILVFGRFGTGVIVKIVNITGVLLGAVAVILLICFPLWIILLVLSVNKHKK